MPPDGAHGKDYHQMMVGVPTRLHPVMNTLQENSNDVKVTEAKKVTLTVTSFNK